MERKKRKNIYVFVFCGAALLIAALCLVSALTEPDRAAKRALEAAASGKADSFELEALQAEVFDVEPTPAPTPIPPAVPAEAKEILSGSTPVCIVPSQADAETLLYTYLEQSAVESSTEHTLSAAIDCEVRIIAPHDNIPLYSVEDALALLLADPSLIPVRLTVSRREIEEVPAATEYRDDASLAKGTRAVMQLGSAERTVTQTELTYRAGEETSAGTPATETLKPGSPTVVRVGTGVFDAETQQKKKQTKADKQQAEEAALIHGEAFPLTFPLKLKKRTAAVPFGVSNGVFRRGTDFEADAGSAVFVPAEGVVIYCGERGEYGFTVDIDHGNGCISRLTHLTDVTAELHQRVFAGDTLGSLAAPADGSVKAKLHYEFTVDGVPRDPSPYWQ